MTNWTQITVEDLDAYLPAGLSGKARTRALSEGQADPFDSIMPDVIAEVRAAVAGCRHNLLDSDPLKIPRSLKGEAVILIAGRLLNRIGEPLSGERQGQIRQAREKLEMAATCRIAIEKADQPMAGQAQRPGGAEFAVSRMREATHEKLKGL